jgi:hypothetical protein
MSCDTFFSPAMRLPIVLALALGDHLTLLLVIGRTTST